jgi:hypothetical protein
MQLIAGCALTILRLLDMQKTDGTDGILSMICPQFLVNPDAPIMQALKIATYLELVFSLSAMFSASFVLCLRIISDREPLCNPAGSALVPKSTSPSSFLSGRNHWFWIMRHCESAQVIRKEILMSVLPRGYIPPTVLRLHRRADFCLRVDQQRSCTSSH